MKPIHSFMILASGAVENLHAKKYSEYLPKGSNLNLPNANSFSGGSPASLIPLLSVGISRDEEAPQATKGDDSVISVGMVK